MVGGMIGAPKASWYRRLFAQARGIRRRVAVGQVRRFLARKVPNAPWRRRHETAIDMVDSAGAMHATALAILLRWEFP